MSRLQRGITPPAHPPKISQSKLPQDLFLIFVKPSIYLQVNITTANFLTFQKNEK